MIYPIKICWGPDFQNVFDLNSNPFRAKTVGLFNATERDIKLGDTVYNAPFAIRAKPKERVFSILYDINEEPSTEAFNNAQWALNQAIYSGPIKVQVWRRGFGFFSLECQVEDVTQVERTQFEIKLTAADPVFTYAGAEGGPTGAGAADTIPSLLAGAAADGRIQKAFSISSIDTTVLVPGVDADSSDTLPLAYDIPYIGSAPAEPLVMFRIGARGGRFRYYRSITLTNNAPEPLTYYPICVNLGDISALVGNANYAPHVDPASGKKFFVDGPAGVPTTVGYPIKDIRVESEGGARKVIWIRDRDPSLGTDYTHNAVKVWFVLYNLAAGASKVVRVLYGNAVAFASEIYPEESAVRMMFNGYSSDNTSWVYTEFCPAWNTPQTRAKQWQPWSEGQLTNISQLRAPHPLYDVSPAGNVQAAGGRTLFYGPGAGAAGMQLTSPVGIASISGWTYKTSNNSKMPLRLRLVNRDGSQAEAFARPAAGETFNTALRTTIRSTAAAGQAVLLCDSGIDLSGIVVGDYVVVTGSDSSQLRYTVAAVNNLAKSLTLTTNLTVSANVGANVTQGRGFTGSTLTFASANPPRTLIFYVRDEAGTLNLGEWYTAGVEVVAVNFLAAEYPAVTAWGSAAEVDLLAPSQNGYQLRGRFGNPYTGEYLFINTTTHNLFDIVEVDCKARTCQYFAWNGAGYDAPVNRYEALTFPTIGRYWLHLDPTPSGAGNKLEFIHSPDSNFSDLDVILWYETRFW